MNKFTIYLKDGGSNKYVSECWQALSKKFDALSNEVFTDIAVQFHIELRVNGRYLSFDDLEGCNHLRYMKKRELVAICISLGKNIWSDPNDLKQFLNGQVLLAFKQIIVRLEKEKIKVDSKRLLGHVSAILK